MVRNIRVMTLLMAISALLVLTMLMFGFHGAGKIITVDDDGGGADFSSIQDAVNASVDGDEIHVFDGEYSESILIEKRLDLVGMSDILPIINGTGYKEIVTIGSDWVNLSGFNITRSDYISYCKGMIVQADNVTLSENTIYSNYYGIHLEQGSCFNTIIGNYFTGSTYAAVKLDEDADHNTLLNNTFIEGGSLSLEFSDHNIIDGNEFIRNSGLGLYYSHFNKIGNTTCTYGYGFGTNGASYNTIFNLTSNWNEGSGVVLKSGEENSLSNIISSGNKECGLFLDSQRSSTFDILNCSENDLDGISIIDRANGNTFSRVISVENGEMGFSCESSNDISLSDANISLNGDRGVHFISSDRLLISACAVSWNSGEGMYLKECEGNNILNNTCIGNEWGVRLESCDETTLVSNIFSHSENTGVYFHSTYYEITNNTCDFNGLDGLYLQNGGHTISGNSFSNNGRTGLVLYRSNSNLIINNTISHNERGLWVTGSTMAGQYSEDNNAHYNVITFNTAYGIDLSGNDDNEINATENWWGHVTGPYNPVLNPEGQGDNITDDAPFDPWTGKPTPAHNLDKGIDYFTIQEAIDDAENGNSITVDPGIYKEALTIDRELTIDGSGSNMTIINGEAMDLDVLIHLTADKVSLRGFGIIGNRSLDSCSGILVDSNSSSIENNRILNCSISVHLRESESSTLSGNEMEMGGIFIEGAEEYHWSTLDIDDSNSLNGGPVQCLVSEDGVAVPSNAGQVILGNCQNVIVAGLKISDAYCGILAGFTSNSIIENNSVRDCQFGISITSQSINNHVLNNTCENNSYAGILLRHSGENNTISGNRCSNSSWYGIWVDNFCDNNLVSSNDCRNNGDAGIHLDSAGAGNLVCLNSCQFNKNGILLSGGENRADGNDLSFNRENGLLIQGRNIGSNNSCHNNLVHGIDVSNSYNTILENNTCGNNSEGGISLWKSSYCTLSYNILELNNYGVKIMGTSNWNLLNSCMFELNDDCAKFGDSKNNILQHCTFKSGGGSIELVSYSTENEIHFSNILVGINNNPDSPLNATNNWWGTPSGKKETSKLKTKPWLMLPFDYFPPEAMIQACPAEVDIGTPVVLSAGGSVYQQVTLYEWSSNVSGELYNGNENTIIIVDPLPIGVHEIKLRIRDDLWIWSDPVITNLHVIDPTSPPPPDPIPTIAIISPANHSTLSGIVNITGTANINNGSIIRVEISIDGQDWQAIIGAEEWYHHLNTNLLSNGTHTISLRAFDGNEHSPTISLSIIIENDPSTVSTNIPTISIISPSNHSTLSGIVNITGIALIENASILIVEISVDDNEWQAITGTEEWYHHVNTGLLSNGPHSIRLRAYDGTEYSRIVSLVVTTNNDQPVEPPEIPKENESETFIPSFLFTNFFIACLIAIGVMNKKRGLE